MKNKFLSDRAKAVAEVYAPRPQSSAVIYGVVATSLASVALVLFCRFYDLDAVAYPLWIGGAGVLIFLASMILQLHLVRRHRTAHRVEYDKLDT